MAYADLNTIHNPATGTVAPATWGDQVRDNDEFLIDPPAVSVFESSAQTITNVTTTALISNEENYDNAGMHSTVSNTSRLTAQVAGRYLTWGRVLFAASTAGTYRQISFQVNGTTEYLGQVVPFVNDASISTVCSATATVVLAVSDYIELTVRHNVNPNLNATMLEFGAMFMTR